MEHDIDLLPEFYILCTYYIFCMSGSLCVESRPGLLCLIIIQDWKSADLVYVHYENVNHNF